MESRPILSVPVHDYLKMHLCDLYENDCIFDKFEVAANHDATYVVSACVLQLRYCLVSLADCVSRSVFNSI
jgi:hypothetical protein